jgi:CheY-like chemotaxis protein
MLAKGAVRMPDAPFARYPLPPERAMMPHILVVDDDPSIRELVQEILEDDGYQVITVADGDEAISHLATDPPVLMLLDLNMPRVTGWEVTERVQRTGPRVPIVFMTAGNRAQREAERYGVCGWLAKPFDLDELLHAVAHCLPRPA